MAPTKKQKISYSDSEFRNLLANFHNPALSAQTIAENQEILSHILHHLPKPTVVRFKCVSRLWYSFISSFICSYNLSLISQAPPDMLFVPNRDDPWKFKYLSVQGPSVEEYGFFDLLDPKSVRIRILHSCNGLTLCRSNVMKRSNNSRNENSNNSLYDYFVCNVALKQSHKLPGFSPRAKKRDHQVFFSFDPFVSPHYTVVCASPWQNKKLARREFQIEVYTSNTRQWEIIEGKLTIPLGNCDDSSFFRMSWNSWIILPGSPWSDNICCYLDVKEKCIKSIDLPPYVGIRRNRPNFATCGSSLYLIDTVADPTDKLNPEIFVYERKKDASDWTWKYKIDRGAMDSAFPPAMIVPYPPQFVSCVRGKEEDDLVLILDIPCRIVAFSVKDKSCKTLIKLWRSRRHLFSRIDSDFHLYYQTLFSP